MTSRSTMRLTVNHKAVLFTLPIDVDSYEYERLTAFGILLRVSAFDADNWRTG